MHRLILTLSFMVLLATSAFAVDKPTVFVSVQPQQYFVEKIAGERVNTSIMVRPGASPATYEPSPKQLAELSKAAAYLSIGAPFEAAWLKRIQSTNTSMPIIATDKGIKKLPMASHDHHDRDNSHDDGHHDDDHTDEATIMDPHIWVSPMLSRAIARNTAAALIQIDPDGEAIYTKNLAVLITEIGILDSQIRTILSAVPKNKRTFLVFHPSWGYFANEYGLIQVPIEAEGKEPGPKALMRIIHEGREEGVSVVFVQPQFSTKSAKVIAAELNARVVPLDPLAQDWATNLYRAASTFKEALQ